MNREEEATMGFDRDADHDGRWIDAGRFDDFSPGQMRTLDIGRIKILIANVEGEPLAVADTCTHEDASLATGSLKGDKVKCPLHGSRFCLRTGRPLDDPAEIDLECFPARLKDQRVQVFVPNKNP
jgi:3-phenylpropionate/trans-cinnamate dioxygenase ferredoxin subunit